MPLALRLWLGRLLFKSLGTARCTRISRNRMIKGPTLAAEADALLYVAANTTVRVPKVHYVYARKSGIYIEMEYVKGRNLETIWNTLSAKDKERIMKMLADVVAQLRKLGPETPGMVASATGKESKELRLSYAPFGPFESVDEFHAYVRKYLPMEATKETFGEEVFRCHMTKYRVCMTHADLTLRNMIIDKKGRLALIDWEMAGWRPEYWEYTKAFYDLISAQDFYDLIKMHFVNYELELAAEKHLWKVFDRP